jgi:UDP-N-acetylglucosamine 1-carboxyvinyltransferase
MNIKVRGGQKLSGDVYPSGSKNSAVALIPATLLFDKPVTLQNIPDITDVDRLIGILRKLGSVVNWNKDNKTLEIDNSGIRFENLTRDDLGNMKGTSLLWGPMLARFGKVNFEDLPGGCTLGVRPLDPHYIAFRALGVVVDEGECSASMDASNAKSGEVWLTEMSPTATENVIMLATGLTGTTRIVGAASEPQVQDLCGFLIKCGATIRGVGSSILEIDGGKVLTPTDYALLSDHYEIATFLALGAATGGKIYVHNALPQLFHPLAHVFSKFGLIVKYDGDTAYIEEDSHITINGDGSDTLIVKAQPWPALPVDTLPLFIPLALAAKKGSVLFHNWMYESGLFWTSELTKLGGNVIMADPHRVLVISGNKLHSAKLEAPYIIRAVVAMVMAAMSAEGETEILNADALYRGHPHFAENLRKLGALIEEVG